MPLSCSTLGAIRPSRVRMRRTICTISPATMTWKLTQPLVCSKVASWFKITTQELMQSWSADDPRRPRESGLRVNKATVVFPSWASKKTHRCLLVFRTRQSVGWPIMRQHSCVRRIICTWTQRNETRPVALPLPSDLIRTSTLMRWTRLVRRITGQAHTLTE